MRPDLDKLLVERPRWGSRGTRTPQGSRRALQRRGEDQENLPERESLRRRWSGEEKLFGDNLAPLRRFLASRVGRSWNRVHAELCSTLDRRSTVQKHVFDHVWQFVHLAVRIEQRRVLAAGSKFTWSELPHGEFYVHPRTGILRRYSRPGSPTRTTPQERLPHGVGAQLHRLDGHWFTIELSDCLQLVPGSQLANARRWARGKTWSLLPRRDVLEGGFPCAIEQGIVRLLLPAEAETPGRLWLVESARLEQRYGETQRFGRSKRQIGAKELKKLGLEVRR